MPILEFTYFRNHNLFDYMSLLKITFSSVILFCLLQIVSSCKSELYSTVVTGKVINSVTKQPIEGAIVKISDESGGGSILFSANEATVIDYDTTDANGLFSVSIKSKSKDVQFVANKSSYEYVDEDSGAEGISIGYGIHNLDAKLKGLAYFNAPFQKSSSTTSDNDSLRISILSYDNLMENYESYDTQIYEGKGPFYFWYEGPSIQVWGDKFLRYKLEFTNKGIWETKIDSIFMPPSNEVYTQTIFF